MPVTKEQIPTDLTLEIGADLQSVSWRPARAFFGYIHELSESFAPEGDLPSCIVRVREGSTLLAVDPTPNVAPEVINIILSRAERVLMD